MTALLRFLRYNSRHTLYWHPTYTQRGGARIVLGWSLNPIGSMYDGKQKVWHEPLRLFRLRQRLFSFSGRVLCQDRYEATWDLGPDGCRTCSACGSAHPEDMLRICRLSLDNESYGISGTDKGYKYYLEQPGVRNAGEGAIKFYMWHAPATPTDTDQALFQAAVRISAQRFQTRMDARFPLRSRA